MEPADEHEGEGPVTVTVLCRNLLTRPREVNEEDGETRPIGDTNEERHGIVPMNYSSSSASPTLDE